MTFVRSVSGRLRRWGTAPESPTLADLFFDDLRDAGGNQVVDSSELLVKIHVVHNANLERMIWSTLFLMYQENECMVR